jgi:hypothetical protein
MGTGVTLAVRPPRNLIDAGWPEACCWERPAEGAATRIGILDLLNYFGNRWKLCTANFHNESIAMWKSVLDLPHMRFGDAMRKFYGQAERPISTGKLHALLRFHLPPIKVVVFDWPS